MIILKSKKEIELLREAGKIVADTHEVLRKAISPGISTLELDKIAQTINLMLTGNLTDKIDDKDKNIVLNIKVIIDLC